MADTTHTAFFYGTLMARAVLHRVIHGTTDPLPWQREQITVRPALLRGYQRHKVAGADYPAIRAVAGASVRGSLVTGLNAQDMRRLDVFEGEQYVRKSVAVSVLPAVRDGEAAETVQAETYVWVEGAGELEVEEWDFEEFRREKMWAWVGETRSADVEVDEGFADVDRFVQGEEGGARQNGVARELEDSTAADAASAASDPTGGRGIGGRITKELESLQGSGANSPRVVGEQDVWRNA